MSAVTTDVPSGYRTPKWIRVALLAVIGLIALFVVAQWTITLLDLAARHTTTQVEQFDGVRALVIKDASDVRLTTAPAGEPLELRTKLTEGLRRPDHDARVTGDGTLLLSSSCGWVFGNSCGVDYEISVPAGTRLDVRSGSGDVRADELSSTLPVRIDASSGDVHVAGVRAPALHVHSSSGDIHATGVRADDVDISASSGDANVLLTELADRVAVSASSGDVHLEVPDAVYRLETEAGSGDIDDTQVRTSPDASRSIAVTTGSGDIHVETR